MCVIGRLRPELPLACIVHSDATVPQRGLRLEQGMGVVVALFAAGIAMGIAGACMWAWGVHTGQLRDLERTKEQLFWPDLAPGSEPPQVPRAAGEGTPVP